MQVLKGNAARLHSGAWSGHGEGIAGVPGFIGRKIGKRRFQWVFENVRDQFERVNASIRRAEKTFTFQAGRGLQIVSGFSQNHLVKAIWSFLFHGIKKTPAKGNPALFTVGGRVLFPYPLREKVILVIGTRGWAERLIGRGFEQLPEKVI